MFVVGCGRSRSRGQGLGQLFGWADPGLVRAGTFGSFSLSSLSGPYLDLSVHIHILGGMGNLGGS